MQRIPLAALSAAVSLLASALAADGQTNRSDQAAFSRAIASSLENSGRFLRGKQAPDGAWRSETYGVMRDGPTLTPTVASVMFFLSDEFPALRESYRRGADYLIGFVREDGSIDPGERQFDFPVYTSAGASWTVMLEDRGERCRKAQKAWLDYLCARRLSAALGWRETDAEFGGWGYAIQVPRRPDRDDFPRDVFSSNLSATIFGIGALRAAGRPSGDPIYREILAFVQRCQNFSEDASTADAQFDDGGFFFSPTDSARNKPGATGKDCAGRERYASYGSMTCDGVRALLRCGLPRTHPRVVAAEQWISRHFSVKTNPGVFARDREVLRDSYYFYYCWSLAHAMTALETGEVNGPSGKVSWARSLAEELIQRQQPDGSWKNRFSDGKEDDPLVATPFATAALLLCQWELSVAAAR